MYVLITYDVSTADLGGTSRLRRVAKICTRYGQRVQNSVFECLVEPAQYEMIKHELLRIADTSRDSLRFYNLGKNWRRRVEHFGVGNAYDPESPMIL